MKTIKVLVELLVHEDNENNLDETIEEVFDECVAGERGQQVVTVELYHA